MLSLLATTVLTEHTLVINWW